MSALLAASSTVQADLHFNAGSLSVGKQLERGAWLVTTNVGSHQILVPVFRADVRSTVCRAFLSRVRHCNGS